MPDCGNRPIILCSDLYNRALAQAFPADEDHGLIFANGVRLVAGGQLPISVIAAKLGWKASEFKAFFPADAFDLYGFIVRNRTPGLGVPLIGVMRNSEEAPNGGALPITAFLRVSGGLRELAAGQASAYRCRPIRLRLWPIG